MPSATDSVAPQERQKVEETQRKNIKIEKRSFNVYNSRQSFIRRRCFYFAILQSQIEEQLGISLFGRFIVTDSNIQICCPVHNNGQEKRPSCGISRVDKIIMVKNSSRDCTLFYVWIYCNTT